jgi:hypothetical protein
MINYFVTHQAEFERLKNLALTQMELEKPNIEKFY